MLQKYNEIEYLYENRSSRMEDIAKIKQLTKENAKLNQ
jgi:hypothetical protein